MGILGVWEGRGAVETLNFAAAPAEDSTKTLWNPAFSKVATPAGVSATLRSRSKVSLGIPVNHKLVWASFATRSLQMYISAALLISSWHDIQS